MATSGSFSTNSYNGRYLTFEWTRTNYSIAENWSEISWTLKGGGSAPSSWYYSGPFWVWFGDDLIWSSDARIQLYDGTVVASGTKRLWHYSDGTYSFHPWIRGAIYNTAWNVEAHQVYDLDTIPRISTFTLSAGSVEMGSNQKVSIQTASPSFTHKLWYRVGSSAWTVIADNIGNVYNWTVPVDIANYIPNNTSCTVELSVETFNGSTNLGEKRATFTATVPASVVPSISNIAISDPTSLASTYGGYVQTKSQVKIEVSASGSYSSSIRSISINDGMGTVSNSNPYTSNAISVGGGTKTVTVTVTDSRGRTATRTASFTVLGYSSPVISQLSAHRCTNNGTADDGGEYMKISFSASITPLNNHNGKSFTVQYKKQTDSSWSTAGTKTDAYSWSSSIVVSANTEYTYDVRFVVSDNFATNTYATNVSTAFTLMDFNKSGRGIAIGKVSEKDAFECTLPAVISDGQISRNTGGAFIAGRDNAVVKQTRCTTYEGSSWNPVASVKTGLGNWTIGNVGGEKLAFSYDTDSNYNAGINTSDQIYLEPRFGTIALKSDVEKQIGDVYFLVNSYMGSNVSSNNGDVAIAYGTTSMRNGQYLIFGVFHVKQSDGTGWARVSMDGSVVASAAVSSEAVGAARIAFLMGTLNLYQDKSVAWQVTINGTGAGTMSNILYQNCILMALRVKGL